MGNHPLLFSNKTTFRLSLQGRYLRHDPWLKKNNSTHYNKNTFLRNDLKPSFLIRHRFSWMFLIVVPCAWHKVFYLPTCHRKTNILLAETGLFVSGLIFHTYSENIIVQKILLGFLGNCNLDKNFFGGVLKSQFRRYWEGYPVRRENWLNLYPAVLIPGVPGRSASGVLSPALIPLGPSGIWVLGIRSR